MPSQVALYAAANLQKLYTLLSSCAMSRVGYAKADVEQFGQLCIYFT